MSNLFLPIVANIFAKFSTLRSNHTTRLIIARAQLAFKSARLSGFSVRTSALAGARAFSETLASGIAECSLLKKNPAQKG